jgi:hypothetical protein
MATQGFVWSECVADFKDQDVTELCTWRGYEVEMVRWLRQYEEIGRWYVPRKGWCVALPVRDENGDVYRCHCRNRGSEWQYDPSAEGPISALVLGNLATSRMIFVHESEWDALAQISVLRMWDEIDSGEICVMATRGPESGRLGLVAEERERGTGVYLIPQNDQPKAKGHIPSEEWLKDCLEAFESAYVARIPTQHKDLNDWIRAKEFSVDQLEYAIENAVLEKRKSKFPEIVTGDVMRRIRPPIAQDVIKGILAVGEKGSLAGETKAFKTWSLIHQSLAIACGASWLGFDTVKSNVLYLNLELPPANFEERVHTVAFAVGLEIPDNFNVWHLRRSKLGDPNNWDQFLIELRKRCLAIEQPFIASDPIYKLLGGRDENRAGDVGELLEQMDDLIEATEGSNFYGQHMSKGNQAAKEAIDRAAGSGVFARDPDTLLIMTRLKKAGAFVLDAILRNHAPVEPFAIEWRHPIFVRNPLLDPGELKEPRKRATKYDMHMLSYWLGEKRLKTTAFTKLVHDETGMGSTTFHELLKEAEAAGLIKRDPADTDYWIKK